jgi:hypothetical protein
MANFEAPLLEAPVTTAFKSSGVLYATYTANLARRIMVYEIEFGQTGSLASSDCQCQWDVSRFSVTAALVATASVPNNLDPADTSPLAQFLNNASTELTYTAGTGFGLNLKSWAINQRGSYRWRALDDGDNIIVAATAGQGIGVRTLSSGFGATAIGNVSFIER